MLLRSLYELNANLSAVKSEQDAARFIRFGKFQQMRLLQQRLDDEVKHGKRAGGAPNEIAPLEAQRDNLSSKLDGEFAEFKLLKGGWQKSWSGQNVEQLARDVARDTGAPSGESDYWIFRLASLFTHNEPGALVADLKDEGLSPEGWREIQARRDQGGKQGSSAILYEASACFVDIVGISGPYIQGYERPWFDEAIQRILSALRR